MSALLKPAAALLRSEEAASPFEYGVLLATITAVAVAAFAALNKGIHGSLGQASAVSHQSADLAMSGGADADGKPTEAGEPEVLFADDFGDASGPGANPWTLTGAPWQYADGRLIANAPKGKELRAFANGSESKDSTVSVDVTPVSGKGFGLFLRASGTKINGYSLQYEPGAKGGQFLLRKWINGVAINPPVARAKAPPGFSWNGTTKNVEVSARGPAITAKVDGATVLTAKDATYTSGKAGLRVLGPSEVHFDNFRISQP